MSFQGGQDFELDILDESGRVIKGAFRIAKIKGICQAIVVQYS